jgi:daunorubicin C-13 ketoreductase
MYRLFYRFAPLLTTPEGGADTMLWLAAAPPGELTDGGYYVKRRLREPAPPTGDAAFASRLWEISATATGLAG